MKVSSNTEWLFFHLWKKNPYSLKPCEGVMIPDTLFYRWAQPFAWYFNNGSDLEITRKTKDKILPENIIEHFTRNASTSGVIASYITSGNNDIVYHAPETVEFEYLEKESFLSLISTQDKSLNAILQKFVEPRHGRNFMIKVSWTPQFCLLYKKTNFHDIGNKKVNINTRVSTFEGPEHLCESESVASSILSEELQKACLRMVNHIEVVSGNNIQLTKLVLYFKIDSQNCLWLLFCTGLKFRERSAFLYSKVPLKTTHSKNYRPESPILRMRDPRQKKKEKKQATKRIYYIEGEMQDLDPLTCIQCENRDSSEFFSIPMKKLITYWENYPDEVAKFRSEEQELIVDLKNELDPDLKTGVVKKDERIPDIVYKLYPFLTFDQYQTLKKQKKLLEYEAKICLDCYLAITETVIYKKTEYDAKTYQLQLKKRVNQKEDPSSLQKMISSAQQPKPQGQEDADQSMTSKLKIPQTTRTDSRAKSFKIRSKGTSLEPERSSQQQLVLTGLVKESETQPKSHFQTMGYFIKAADSTGTASPVASQINHSKNPSGNSQAFLTAIPSKQGSTREYTQKINKEKIYGQKNPKIQTIRTIQTEPDDWKGNFRIQTEETHETERYKRKESFATTYSSPKTIFGDRFRTLTSRGESPTMPLLSGRLDMHRSTKSVWSSSQTPIPAYKNNFKSVSATIKDLKAFLQNNAVDL